MSYSWDTEDNAFEANVAFIRGELKETPYHLAPISHEISPALLTINKRFRIFTFGGQEGTDEEFDDEDEDGLPDKGHIQQRPFLSFYIESHRVEGLVEWFVLRNYLVELVLPDGSCFRCFPGVERITPKEEYRGKQRGRAVTRFVVNEVEIDARDASGAYWVTRVVYDDMSIFNYTHLASGRDNVINGLFEKWVQVDIIDPTWGSPTKIEDLVLRWCIAELKAREDEEEFEKERARDSQAARSEDD